MGKTYTIKEICELSGGLSYNGAKSRVESYIKKVKNAELSGSISYETERREGKSVTVVNLSDNIASLMFEHSEINYNSPSEISSSEVESNNSSQNFTNSEGSETTLYLVEKLAEQNERLVDYAERAGQHTLLTDKLNTEEANSKFYQDKYFEMQDRATQAELSSQTQLSEIKSLKRERLVISVSFAVIAVITLSLLIWSFSLRNESVSKTAQQEVQPTIESTAQPVK